MKKNNRTGVSASKKPEQDVKSWKEGQDPEKHTPPTKKKSFHNNEKTGFANPMQRIVDSVFITIP
jgi:hypothetical protein